MYSELMRYFGVFKNRSFNVRKDKRVFLTDKMFDRKYFCTAYFVYLSC